MQIEPSAISREVVSPVTTTPSQDANLRSGRNIEFLRANNRAYEVLVQTSLRSDVLFDPAESLRSISRAARFACRFHPGRFSDARIENAALRIGARLSDSSDLSEPPAMDADSQSRRRVLHVASRVFEIGGHTRMLYRWIRADRSSTHSVVLTDQGGSPIPSWLLDVVRRSGGTLVDLDGSLVSRAAQLRIHARSTADVVILHHGGTDPVPTAAFAIAGGPPVAVLNHADHAFWLGSGVADLLIDLRTADGVLSNDRRCISNRIVLPIPLETPGGESRVPLAGRAALGIPPDRFVILSIGRAVKYRPCGAYDFVAVVNEVLNRHVNTHLYIIGAESQEVAPYLRAPCHERIHFLGSMEDPSEYLGVADLYLESFPFGSNTSFLEAALHGIAVVPALRPMCPLLVARTDALDALVASSMNEDEYLRQVDELIRDRQRRCEFGEQIREQLQADHVGEGWLAKLDAVYARLHEIRHSPHPIPMLSYEETDLDVALATFSAATGSRALPGKLAADAELAVRRHAVFVSRDVGDHARAIYEAFRALRYAPTLGESWRTLLVALSGRPGLVVGSGIRRYGVLLRQLANLRAHVRRRQPSSGREI